MKIIIITLKTVSIMCFKPGVIHYSYNLAPNQDEKNDYNFNGLYITRSCLKTTTIIIMWLSFLRQT